MDEQTSEMSTGLLPWDSPGFNTKRGGNAGQREDSKLAALGLNFAHIDQLAHQFQADFLARDYGYRQLSALDDPLLRAVASSRVRSAISGVGRNLLEARLHEHHVHRTIGPNGLAWPGPETTIADDLARDELELHIAGAFRSVGSALDCLACVLIGVVRIPRSLARADLLDVTKLDPDKMGKQLPARPQRQHDLWVELRELMTKANDGPPQSWLDWTLQMRNALLHRGRGLTKMSNRPLRISQPIYVEGDHAPHELVRYDPHLTKRPWLTDLQNLVIYGGPFDHWLAETVPETISGLRQATNRLCEEAAAWALNCWNDYETQATFAADARAWAEAPITLDFEGFVPRADRSSDVIVTSPNETEFVLLAQRLVDEGHSIAVPRHDGA